MKMIRTIAILITLYCLGLIVAQPVKQLEKEGQNDARMLASITETINRLTTALGPRFYLFLTCMGGDFTLECGQKMLDCAARGNAPWECIGGIFCSGKSAFQCIKTSA